MAKRPQTDKFADNYAVESERIWEEAAGIIIWPSWEIYQKFKLDYDDNPDDPKWEPLTCYGANPFPHPIEEKDFAKWREKQISKYVEEDCKALVRHILDKGHFTFYSNAAGHGTKGVALTNNWLNYKATGEGYFYFLKEWDTNPHIAEIQHQSFGSITCRLPGAIDNEFNVRYLRFDELPQPAQPAAAPARPAAKAKRKAKPRKRDRAPGSDE